MVSAPPAIIATLGQSAGPGAGPDRTASRAARRLGRGRTGLDLAQLARERLEQLPGDARSRLHERPELPDRQAVRDEIGVRGHVRRAIVLLVDQRDLAEMVALLQRRDLAVAHGDGRLALADHEEADPSGAGCRDRVAGLEDALVEGGREARGLTLVEVGEQGHLSKELWIG